MPPDQQGAWDRRLRDQIAQAVLNNETEVTFYGQVPKEGLFDAVQDMLDEHPEVFWVSGASSMCSSLGQRILTLEPLYPPRAVSRMRGELAASLAHVAGLARAGSTDLERLELAYEWFCTHLRYAPSARAYEDQTSYAALCLRQAVCAGFARGFQLVLDALGVQGGVVVGSSDLRSVDRHAWNYVVLDGEPLHVDVTAGICSFARTHVLCHPLYLLPETRVQGFRYVRDDAPGAGREGQARVPDLPFVATCSSKKELRALLYRDCSQVRSPSGSRCALTVLIDPGVFETPGQFRAHMDKLLAGSVAGMGFTGYCLHGGYVLELW